MKMRIITSGLAPFCYMVVLAQQFGPQHDVSFAVADPGDFVIQDMDMDGWKDVFVSSTTDGKIGWWRNLQGTGFAPFALVQEHVLFSSLDLGDVDGDGDPDVVVLQGLDVILFRNQGAGLFSEEPLTLATSPSALGIRLEDLDSDGYPEIILWSLSDLRKAHNQGDGTFASTQILQDPFLGCRILRSMDWDGDLDVDLVYAAGGSLKWLENDGAGQYGAPLTIGSVSNAKALLIADMDADGDDDITAIGNFISWFEHVDGGGYAAHTIWAADSYGTVGTLVDIDADGDMDLIRPRVGGLLYHLNNGPDFSLVLNDLSVNGPKTLLVDDIDQDGDLDVLVMDSPLSSIRVFKGTATFGEYEPAMELNSPTTFFEHISVADMDGNGTPDLIASGKDLLCWYANNGDWSFGAAQVVSPLAEHFIQAFPADLDQNGSMDLAVIADDLNAVRVFVNNGSGGFPFQTIVSYDIDFPTCISGADLDGDGDVDLITGSYLDHRLGWHENMGGMLFGPRQTISTAFAYPKGIHPVDMDSDGDVDLVIHAITGDQGSGVHWLKNMGNGQFEAPILITTVWENKINVVDMESDGDLDVIVAQIFVASEESATSSIVAWQNDGNQNFTQVVLVPDNSFWMGWVEAEDYTGDGQVDLVYVTDEVNSTLSLDALHCRINSGNGQMEEAQVVSLEDRRWSHLTSADLDGDLDLDLITVSTTGKKVAAYENLGLPTAIGELAKANVILMPNPIQGSAVIQINGPDGLHRLDVIDHLGRTIRSEQVTSSAGRMRMAQGSISSGSYVLRISSAHSLFSIPFVVE